MDYVILVNEHIKIYSGRHSFIESVNPDVWTDQPLGSTVHRIGLYNNT